jgi:predicted metal-dependent hydrolase
MLRLFRRDPPPEREADFINVSHGGETYRIRVKRTAAAKRFTLRVRTATRDVMLTMPARASFRDGQSFAERHRAWVGAKMRHLPEKIGLEPGDTVPLRGVAHKIALAPRLSERGAVAASPQGAGGGGPMLWVSGDAVFTPRRVQDFLIREARRDLTAAVGFYAARACVEVRKISLRDTSSRWGSCSASGSLNFSWRLILAPPFVLDYLAAHEVAHMVHMNHSDAFWDLAGDLSPDVAAAEAWLKAHGPGLLRFGAAKGAGRSNPPRP